MSEENLKTTPFTAFHRTMNARMTSFAGYDMPVSFEGGLAEHHHVRNNGVGLFDVSHMGQIYFSGTDVIEALEKLLPTDIHALPSQKCKYSLVLNDAGGITDDIILSKDKDGNISAVVNGSRKYIVLDHFKKYLPENVTVTLDEHRALLALQGKNAVHLLSQYCPALAQLKFMEFGHFILEGIPLVISRSGYTGEDGVEISVTSAFAGRLYEFLIGHKEIKPIGLGARDTLRLEAGLCLYGNDLNETITPIEAGLQWAISKKQTGNLVYKGSEIIKKQLEQGTNKIRVGLRPEGKAPIREGVLLFDADDNEIGFVSSGGFSPSLNIPIAMGYVHTDFSQNETMIFAALRGKKIPVLVSSLPFVPHHYVK